MRDIKFRGISKESNEFIYGWLVKNMYGNYSIVTGQNKEDFHKCIPVVEGSEGQYTGLKDNSGEEVYEGDLIEVHENKNGYFEVVFVNAYVGGWVLKYMNEPLLSLGARSPKEIEIIGNIHE